MKQAERDRLLIEQTEALNAMASRIDRLTVVQERRTPFVPPLPRAPRRRPTWESFEKVVPASHLEGDPPTVTCPCGAKTTLTLRLPMMCEGECGRAFVRVRNGPVRCHHFGTDEEQEAAAA